MRLKMYDTIDKEVRMNILQSRNEEALPPLIDSMPSKLSDVPDDTEAVRSGGTFDALDPKTEILKSRNEDKLTALRTVSGSQD